MHNFALRKIKNVSPPTNSEAKCDFFELEVDGTRPGKALSKTIAENDPLREELNSLYDIMWNDARNNPLPGTKKHPLRNQTPGGTEFEYKTKHLRAYGFKSDIGKIITSIVRKEGKQNTQDNDIKRFQQLKQEYLNSLSQ